MAVIKTSVRKIVELVFRSGSIDFSSFSFFRMAEGAQGHRLVQSSRSHYRSEVYVQRIFNKGEHSLEITGRIDGIIETKKHEIIEEIKTTHQDIQNIEPAIQHEAQMKLYAAIYALDNDLEEMNCVLTYFNIDTEETREFYYNLSLVELNSFVDEVLTAFLSFYIRIEKSRRDFDETVESLEFPFDPLREGQKQLMDSVSDVIFNGRNLISQAPTGIGKTMSVLYPAIRSLGTVTQGIFFLTAKTPGRNSAINAVKILQARGLRLKALVINAKEKICTNKEVDCESDKCPFADGHFDRVNDAIVEILEYDVIDYAELRDISYRHMVCPFELSLELTQWVRLVICDYNYVFDPVVRLRRIFDDPSIKLAVLVDEAHNLVNRSRDMYSCQLTKKSLLADRKKIKGISREIYNSLGSLNSRFLDLRKLVEKREVECLSMEKPPEDFINSVSRCSVTIENWLGENRKHPGRKEISEIYFTLNRFLKIADIYTVDHVFTVEKEGRDIQAKLFCMDASSFLNHAIDSLESAVFFSATLNPFSFYSDMLGVSDARQLALDSPFPEENFLLMIADRISTKYSDRDDSVHEVAGMIFEFINSKEGNFLIFFPSFAYMKDILHVFPVESGREILVQQSNMDEKSRNLFLERFKTSRNTAGFAVMGGIFSEGIDLVGDNLAGAVIVGVGLPRMDFESQLLKNHFEERYSNGFKYAYQYPGFTRVLQAAGRVIRSMNDRGAVLLIGKRFNQPSYRSLFPKWWSNWKSVRTVFRVRELLSEFWAEDEKGYKIISENISHPV
ncbi:MAG: PD-(D/E)XK nuclease family protein [Deltaproteobacteria bacterium]|nr:PD-(D/E)XK nuclease family protein [Deltaproteobacteria bacterium]